MNDLQKRTAQAIVNIFETGRVLGDYGNVTVAKNDLGHLTYGRSQTTLASGNLHLLIDLYCKTEGAVFAAALAPYLARLEARDTVLDSDVALHGTLRAAGNDQTMRAVQDAFFDEVYWRPAATAAGKLGVTTALGVAVVYDGKVHGSFERMRDRTNDKHPDAAGDEQAWIGRYVAVRRAWLAGHSNALLPKTVYRMDTLKTLIDAGKWALPLPLAVRGQTIDQAALEGGATASAEVAEVRILRLRTPFLQGEDVRAVQKALKMKEVDGAFGPATEKAVKAFQAKSGLTQDGVVGPGTRAALGL